MTRKPGSHRCSDPPPLNKSPRWLLNGQLVESRRRGFRFFLHQRMCPLQKFLKMPIFQIDLFLGTSCQDVWFFRAKNSFLKKKFFFVPCQVAKSGGLLFGFWCKLLGECYYLGRESIITIIIIIRIFGKSPGGQSCGGGLCFIVYLYTMHIHMCFFGRKEKTQNSQNLTIPKLDQNPFFRGGSISKFYLSSITLPAVWCQPLGMPPVV